jgi:4-hydroxyacetophenone monooxygenase
MTNVFTKAVEDEAALRAALADADVAPMLMVLTQLSGDTDFMEEVAAHIPGPWSYLASVPDSLKKKLQDKLVAVLQEYASTGREAPHDLPAGLLQRMMSAGVGQPVPDEYLPLLIEETDLDDEDARRVHWRSDPAALHLSDFRVAVIGAGLGGICAGIRLKQLGIPFRIFEKNEDVGGTWLENKYPGCAVDTPNQFYSYSFNQNKGWSREYSKRDEILRYATDTADQYDLRPHIEFGVEVTSAKFNEQNARWSITTRSSRGEVESSDFNAVITAVGQLNRPAYPAISGLSSFKGPVFHTAEWDAGVSLEGKRVAMIGTGASGMQVGPSIAPGVDRLLIFQRTPHWIWHSPNYLNTVSAANRWALEHIPYFQKWLRFQLFWATSDGFHSSLIVDPSWKTPDISLNETNDQFREMAIEHARSALAGREELLAKVIPDYPLFGKRLLLDNRWYEMLKRPNVELITDGISHVTDRSIVLSNGQEYDVDVIVLATGFQASRMLWPMDISGRDDRTIRGQWGDDDPRAYLGITAPAFPNLFFIYGPNTNLAHGGSSIFHFECQVRYITLALREMIEKEYATLEVRQDIHDVYNNTVDQLCRNMVWSHPGVKNWYKNRNNRVTQTSPWRLLDYWNLTKDFNVEDYLVTRPRPTAGKPGLEGKAETTAA